MTSTGFHCATCGQFHDELPMVFGQPAPTPWAAVPEAQRTELCGLSSDQCVIKGEHFFILGRLQIPVVDAEEPFTWLCWVSVSKANFIRANELWHQVGRETEPPYFAWLQSALPYTPSTMNLQANLVTQPAGQRPLIVLQASDHPLAVEQARGITLSRVQQIVEAALHEASQVSHPK